MSATPLPSEDQASDLPSQTSAYTPQHVKSQRVLACVLCQQRKVKCDRRFPCANCIKSRVQCVPATLTQRRRRRRFPERELLERLRKYEELLRQNNIIFDPMSGSNLEERGVAAADSEEDAPLDHGQPARAPPSARSGSDFATKNFWHAMNQGFRGPGDDSDSSHDELREHTVRNALKQMAVLADGFFFGPIPSNQNLSELHPSPVHIFRLWQLYLDNISPLIKITHTPTLQGRIIEAAGNVTNITHELGALMFSIYSITVMTLTNDDCEAMFSSTREALLQKFNAGCQQALWQCEFLRTDSRDCLTAFCLYLMSIRTSIVPQSLSSMLAIAIRTAQRMGINSEAILAKCSPLEAEMRRRLWWFLVLIDSRACEMANAKASSLDPTWDCNIPLNVNDSDLHPEMKKPPMPHAQNTEALFIICRAELADFVRHSPFHLDFVNPALKHVARQTRGSTVFDAKGLAALDERLQHQYLQYCDQENPVQFMTVWTFRALLARYRLLEYHSRASCSPAQPTEAEREEATTFALTMLECDTKIMTSPTAKGFTWLSNVYFPFVAYNHIMQDLKRRPLWPGVQEAWRTMSENHEAHKTLQNSRFRDPETPFLRLFAEMIHGGWEVCERASKSAGKSLAVPSIVSSTQRLLLQDNQVTVDMDISEASPHSVSNPDYSATAMPTLQGYLTSNLTFDSATQEAQFLTTPDLFTGLPMQNYMNTSPYRWDANVFSGWPRW